VNYSAQGFYLVTSGNHQDTTPDFPMLFFHLIDWTKSFRRDTKTTRATNKFKKEHRELKWSISPMVNGFLSQN
jgi:hypothetical protein